MHSEPADRIVQALSVALMNGTVYFPEHRRVAEASKEAAAALDLHFQGRESFVLGVVKGLLIVDGAPLYDLSVRAHRLMDVIGERGGFGIRFSRGITADEIVALVKALLQARTRSAEEFNALLAHREIVHAALQVKPLREAPPQEAASSGREPAPPREDCIAESGEPCVEVYTWALGGIRDFVGNLKRDRKVSLTQTQDIAVRLTDALARDRNGFVAMASVKDYDSYTFNHSVNACIYATAVAEQLMTDKKELVAVAQAALLHDVGKILIPDEVLFKPGALSDAEWTVMRQHPVLGAKILMEAQGAAEIAINVAFGHHLRYDQQGYPSLAMPITVDPLTQLVNVIDVYEALPAKRPYKKPFTPERAADVLLRGVGSEFNPLCVDLFLRHFGIFPPGTPVRLTDGSEGAVATTNPCDAAHPVVHVTRDADGGVPDRPMIVDTAEKLPGGGYRLEIACSAAALQARTQSGAPA
jgi:putative nucleotidyltransferase with HDIG domain